MMVPHSDVLVFDGVRSFVFPKSRQLAAAGGPSVFYRIIAKREGATAGGIFINYSETRTVMILKAKQAEYAAVCLTPKQYFFRNVF